MIHYHGGPITPETCAVNAWKSRHAFISFAHPAQIKLAASITQSFALDNGAFSLWKARKAVDWEGYYLWVNSYLRHPRFDFAVVPDVIGGSEKENDELLAQWRFPKHLSAAVWHSNESVDRLVRLAETWPRVAIGSSGEYDVKKSISFVAYMRKVLPYISDSEGFPVCQLHGLRMLNPKVFNHIPLKSADSTNIARNIGIDSHWKGGYQVSTKEARVNVLLDRIESSVSAEKTTPLKETLNQDLFS